MLSNQIIYRCQVSFAGFLLSSPVETPTTDENPQNWNSFQHIGFYDGNWSGVGFSYGLYTALSYPTPCTEEGLSSNGAISCGLGSIATILYTHTLKFSWQRSLHSVLRFSPVSFLIGGTIFPYLYYHTYMRSSVSDICYKRDNHTLQD
eukprot:TRINITY_DN1898_c0_g1_i1.p1 TRINITY_DN1898_c0_g1~~TRINITY_DN1898_c0_g1_i1.p1  ORF type:complete len:148 (+),score=6.99 TRINITY_DN1898_c0_g1_i1:59-502(+)